MRISSPPYCSQALTKTHEGVAGARSSTAGITEGNFFRDFCLRSLWLLALCAVGASISHAAEDRASKATQDKGYSFNFTGAGEKPSPNKSANGFAKRTLFLPPHATLLPDTTATELQTKIVEPTQNPASRLGQTDFTPPLPTKSPMTASQKRLAQRNSVSEAKSAILSEDSNGLASATRPKDQVATTAATAVDFAALDAKVDQEAESIGANSIIAPVTKQSKTQGTAEPLTEGKLAKNEEINAVPKPVIIQQETASTVILTSSQTNESQMATASPSEPVGAGSAIAKAQLPIPNDGGHSISSDVETDIAVTATNDEIVNPAVAELPATPVKPRQSQIAALFNPVDGDFQEVTTKVLVPLPEAKPDREELHRRASARQKAQRRRAAAARRRAALARARAKAAQAQSSTAPTLPKWVSSALQIAN